MWDNNVWSRILVEITQHSITIKFFHSHNSFTWYLTGVYAPPIRSEKLLLWEEIAACSQLFEGSWVACGDSNTN